MTKNALKEAVALCSAVVLLRGQAPSNPQTLTGFDAPSAANQVAREKQFDASLNRTDMQQWLERLSAKPHHLGSQASKGNAEFIAAQFRSWGYETAIETFYPLFPTPKKRVLELISPQRFTAKLEEPVLPEDKTSGVRQDQLPTYNSYSTDGDVTGQLVYVNYGLPADYDVLAEHGVDVKGKIVIARYGQSWRGIKPKVAAEHGAIGCIIYSDPHDDGYFVGDSYPKGGWRPADAAQRGSVMDMPLYPGDPLTPGVGATKDAPRLTRDKAETITKIPTLPISYADATPLLAALGGPLAPVPFRGALPLTYHLGPGPATVHLALEFDWKLTPAYDIIARMPGGELGDEWIIRGNHHDGWVFGASDPLSGLVPMMEEARGVAALVKNGWKPRRSIVYTVWDGEEPMLLGSTEWAEFHAKELTEHAVAYINSDTNGRGFVQFNGSHTLERFANEVARDVTDPAKKVSALDRYRAAMIVNGSPEDKQSARAKRDIMLNALGSGSDFTPFLQHLGIATLDIAFAGEDASEGVYHSIYDSYDHYTKFDDPDFQYAMALSQLGGRITMRLAEAETIPVRYSGFVHAVAQYTDELEKLADKMRTDTEDRARSAADHSYELAAGPHDQYVEPAPRSPVPYLNFAPLQNAIARLRTSAQTFEALPSGASASLDIRKQLDHIIIQSDRAMLQQQGLPRRPWYRHEIYAPGFYTGYSPKTIPGVREAIEARRWDEATAQIEVVAKTLNAVADQIDRAVALLR
ncbi:MAG TPA: transferrin receptor-like dimerization domain-containing protein [Bryobacteraceae bacterium]|jgi:N-acetylated-alpha-linked acidic dipeptidase